MLSNGISDIMENARGESEDALLEKLKFQISNFSGSLRIFLNVRGNYGTGQTALAIAIQEEYKKIFDFLIELEGIDINVLGDTDFTPLHEALFSDNCCFLQKLIQKNADPHIKNKKGQTPLDLAHSELEKEKKEERKKVLGEMIGLLEAHQVNFVISNSCHSPYTPRRDAHKVHQDGTPSEPPTSESKKTWECRLL